MVVQTVGDLRLWWSKTDLGQYVWLQEQAFFKAAAVDCGKGRTLLAGAFLMQMKEVCMAQDVVLQSCTFPADVLVQNAIFPWQEETFDTVMLSHELDFGENVPVLLHEVRRVVKPYGYLVVTGFNPYSLWRLGGNVPKVRLSLPLTVLKDYLVETGWQIVQGRFMNYLPPLFSQKCLNHFGFLEFAGNRWWPHGAAVYGLVLRKHCLGMNMRSDAAVEGMFSKDMAVLGAACQIDVDV